MSENVPMGTTAAHEIGALSARVRILEDSHLRLESKIDKRLDAMSSAIGEIHDVITSSKGAWRAIVALGGIAAAVAGVVAAFFHWWIRK